MVIIGAKGFAKELLSALIWSGFNKEDLFLFDNVSKDIPDNLFGRFPIIKSWEELSLHFKKYNSEFVLAVCKPKTKYNIANKVTGLGGTIQSFISDQALIGEYGNEIGEGVCILPNVIMSCDVKIGKGTLINKAVIIGHDAQIGEYCSISPCAKILGDSKIGNYSEIGAGAVILPGVTLGDNCIVGAGAVVNCDYPEGSIIAGMPAGLVYPELLIKP